MRLFHDQLVERVALDPHKVAASDDFGPVSRIEFLKRIAGLAQALPPGRRVVGLLAPNGVDWAAAQFAAAFAGKTVVPLPTYFSQGQIAHIVRDASVDFIWFSQGLSPSLANRGIDAAPLAPTGESPGIECVDGFQQIIYTSGTTGQPKGVRHGAPQIAWVSQALAACTHASEQDLYLSVLPLPTLLETICAVFIPALVGGQVRFAPSASDAVGRGLAPPLADLFESVRPTASVLVPQLLKAYVAQLVASGRRAPDNLRFVAVGGASTPPATAAAARRLGIPVHEGYGLSECCSVVALAEADGRSAGSVGRPLQGLNVSIEEGEIVVEGPSVTDGYLGRSNHSGPWRTGDLGEFDETGRLRILGRRDNMLVTSMGRNVSPEWIEALLLADFKVAQCALTCDAEGELAMLVIPSAFGSEWFARASQAVLDSWVLDACAAAPSYARPNATFVVAAGDAVANGLLTGSGGINRKRVAAFAKSRPR